MAVRVRMLAKVRGCSQNAYAGFTDGQGRDVPAGTSTKLLVLDEDSNKVTVAVPLELAPSAMALLRDSEIGLVLDVFESPRGASFKLVELLNGVKKGA